MYLILSALSPRLQVRMTVDGGVAASRGWTLSTVVVAKREWTHKILSVLRTCARLEIVIPWSLCPTCQPEIS
jgi:hypothetical protein